MMPGGTKEAYKYIEPIVTKVRLVPCWLNVPFDWPLLRGGVLSFGPGRALLCVWECGRMCSSSRQYNADEKCYLCMHCSNASIPAVCCCCCRLLPRWTMVRV
jgi:hypothetical protein